MLAVAKRLRFARRLLARPSLRSPRRRPRRFGRAPPRFAPRSLTLPLLPLGVALRPVGPPARVRGAAWRAPRLRLGVRRPRGALSRPFAAASPLRGLRSVAPPALVGLKGGARGRASLRLAPPLPSSPRRSRFAPPPPLRLGWGFWRLAVALALLLPLRAPPAPRACGVRGSVLALGQVGCSASADAGYPPHLALRRMPTPVRGGRWRKKQGRAMLRIACLQGRTVSSPLDGRAVKSPAPYSGRCNGA